MEINEFISKTHFFTKEVTSTGGNMSISIPTYEKANFKHGEKVLVIKLSNIKNEKK